MSTGDVITGFLQTKWKWQSSETVGQQNGVLKNINELHHHMMDYSILSSFLMDWKDTALKLQNHKRSTIHTNSGKKGCICQFPRLVLYEKQHWQSQIRKLRISIDHLNTSEPDDTTGQQVRLSDLRFMVPIGICGNDSKTHLL